MKTSKRVLSLLFALVLTFTMLPLQAMATEPKPETSVDTGDLTVEGTNGFGTLLSQEIQESQEESASAEENYDAGYSIIDLTFEGATATVEYSSLEEAILVVAVYSEDGLQMLASGSIQITPDEELATVTIEGDMPEYFQASAYLMDTYDLSPLCAAYDTPMYTREMQELLASTVNDYDPELVLNLDEDETTNFAVYTDSTIVIEGGTDVNTVVSADNENHTYVIANADQNITALVKGDVFVYPYGEGEMLIVKVAAIEVNGTNVTIIGSEDLEIDDVFSQVKIESTGADSNVTIDGSTATEGIEYFDTADGITPYGAAPRNSTSGEKTHSIGISFDAIKLGGEYANIKLGGKVTFSTTFAIDYYVSASYQRVDISGEVSLEGSLSVSGELKFPIKLGKINFEIIPGMLQLVLTTSFVIKTEGKIEVNPTLSLKTGLIIERGGKQGFTSNGYCEPEAELDTKFEGTFFVGFETEVGIEIAHGLLAEMKVTAEGGEEYTLETDITPEESEDECHLCDICYSGDVKRKFSLEFSAKFLQMKRLSIKAKLLEATRKIYDIYYTPGKMPCFQYGHCPNLAYRLTVNVVDANGNPVKDAVITAGAYSGTTNKKGIAELFLPVAEYELSVTDGNIIRQHTLYMDSAQKVKVRLSPDGTVENIFSSIIPDDCIDKTTYIASGKCGTNVYWTLSDDGILSMAGKGSMQNYIAGESPWYSYRYNIGSVIIGNGVTTIGRNAFSDCTGLTTVKIPDSVTTIGSYAFSNCTRLTKVEIPDSVTTIGENAFSNCTSLTKVKIPDSVTTIDYRAFYGCTGLTSVEIPDSVTTIGGAAFSNCTSLTKVEIPDSVTTIGAYVFSNCTSLTSVEIPDSITAIPDHIFYSCAKLKSVTIPYGVTTIGEAAFAYCDSLTTIMIPGSVTTIGEYAFSNCRSISSAKFPDSVTTIGDNAFEYCTGLMTVEIPDSMTIISSGAFMACTSLTSVKIPDSVTTIGDYAFNSCTGLTAVEIPDSVTTIGDSAFSACSSLTCVTIPNGVTAIARSTFSDCTSLTSVTIPDSVTAIDGYAFAHCDSLTSIEIPDSVTTIGGNAFTDSYNLKEIVFRGNAPAIESTIFGYITATAYYPAGNTTWTSDVMKAFGGYITWVPYTLDENGNMILNEAAAVTVAAEETVELTDTLVPEIEENPVQTGLDLPRRDIGEQDETVSPNAAFDGEYSTVATDSYILKTASFSGLVPGQQYVLLAMVSIDVEDPLVADNLLYIDQAAALEDGTLVFQYVQRTPTDTSYVVACGASSKDLNDAQITFPEMIADGETQVVNPTVVYDGKALTEGQDYTIQGTVSVTEPGTYTCYIRGVRNYAGLVECTYTVISPYYEVASGTCGSNLAWTFYDNGRLTISGTGPMTDFSSLPSVPWYDRSSSVVTVIIDYGVTSIGDFAFDSCTSLTSVTIPDSVTTIGSYVFRDCTSLTSVTIPDNVTTIGSYLFRDCTSLTSAVIGDGVTAISTSAFQYCSKLTSVTIGDSVTTIQYGAFQSCTSLTSVTLPASVSTIGNDVFKSCTNLTGIYVDENNPNYSSDDRGVLFDKEKVELIQVPGAIGSSYEIPASVTYIDPYAFYNCTSLISVIIPDSVTAIGEYTFAYCSRLEYVTIPDGVTTIGDDAFRSCTSLTNVMIPDSVTTIGVYAFYGCISLNEIIFKGNAPDIGSDAFRNVTAAAHYPANDPTWTEDVKQNYGGDITWVPYTVVTEVAAGWSGDVTWKLYDDGRLVFTGPGKMKNYSYKSEMPWYSYMDQIESVVIEDGVTSIGDYAFYGFSIRSIEIPESVTYIGAYAFKNAAALDHVVLPSGLTKLGESAFYACTNLSSIEIPASLWTVQPYTFKNCTALSSVTFHEGNLEKISDGAFYNTALTSVELPDCLDILDSYVFKNCTQLADVKLSAGLTQIREASLYGIAITSIEIPEGVTSIKPYAFKNCVNLETVDLPGTLTSVGEASFYACTELTTLTLPDAVTTIGNYAFRKCIGLTSVSFGSGLTTIGECSFYGCERIATLAIPRGVTTIKAYAFKGCTALKSVRLPSTLTTLGESAFHSCVGLSGIIIPGKVTTIGEYCFSGSTGISTIEFLGNAPAIGEGAFNKITAAAWYPAGDATWTADVMQNYGGSITWKAG